MNTHTQLTRGRGPIRVIFELFQTTDTCIHINTHIYMMLDTHSKCLYAYIHKHTHTHNSHEEEARFGLFSLFQTTDYMPTYKYTYIQDT